MATKRSPDYYLPLWEQAAAHELGIEIQVEPEDQAILVNALYECRKEAGRFADMIICQPQPEGTIMICHKTLEGLE